MTTNGADVRHVRGGVLPLSDRPRIVVLRPLGLGALLTAVPALQGLRAHFPDHRLVLAAPAVLEPLALLTGAVDGVLDTAPYGRVPGWPPRLAVNLHDAGPSSTGTLRALAAEQVWAYGSDGAPAWDAAEHDVTRWCRLLDGYGVTCDPGALDLRTPPDEPPAAGLTVIHPGAGDPLRRWPASRWSAVAEELAGAGHEVVVTGDEAEVALARAVTAGAGLPERACLAGRTSLGELAALVAYARLVLCGDTGVAHLATAYRTPSVVLFGPVAPALCGPPADRPQHRVLWSGPTDEPATGGVDPGLLRIAVEDVLAAVSAPVR